MPFLASLLARRRRRRRRCLFVRPPCPSSRIARARGRKSALHLLLATRSIIVNHRSMPSSSSDPLASRPSPHSDSGTAAEKLTDDLLVEILSRVPAKSLCRFKCVSNHWLSLIDHPDHRKKLPQTLAGFFYTSKSTSMWVIGLESSVHFTSVSGRRRDTSFDFLPNNQRFHLLHCCNGLFLGCTQGPGIAFGYFVVNPATEQWVAFPYCGNREFISPVLAFDPALSSHFHVFQWVNEQDDDQDGEQDDDQDEWDERDGPNLAGVSVYSSETGGWVYKEKKWNEHIGLTNGTKTVFLNGYLHFLADHRVISDCLAVVDTKGETWMNFPVPGGLNEGFIQQSQGRLIYANFSGEDEDGDALRVVVYVLENYQTKRWILTHTAETLHLFGGIEVCISQDFYWVAIHPDCNLLFFIAGCDNTLMCYNMDRRQVKVISNIEVGKRRCFPYVPLYAELPSLHI